MKLNKLALTLTALTLLPAFAYAGTDTVAASFDRAFINDSFINTSRANADQVAASFERDMYRTPVNTMVAIAGEPDALTVEFYVALNGKADPVLASFDRDMDRAFAG